MSAKPLHVTVTANAESPTKLAVSVRDFAFVIDEPPSYGVPMPGRTRSNSCWPLLPDARTSSFT